MWIRALVKKYRTSCENIFLPKRDENLNSQLPFSNVFNISHAFSKWWYIVPLSLNPWSAVLWFLRSAWIATLRFRGFFRCHVIGGTSRFPKNPLPHPRPQIFSCITPLLVTRRNRTRFPRTLPFEQIIDRPLAAAILQGGMQRRVGPTDGAEDGRQQRRLVLRMGGIDGWGPRPLVKT